MKQVLINLYHFNELGKEAKQKAINDHTDFLNSTPEYLENEDGETVEEYIDYTHREESVIESIELNEYLFFEDGTLAHCVQYCGNHPQAGKLELKLHGSIYIVPNF